MDALKVLEVSVIALRFATSMPVLHLRWTHQPFYFQLLIVTNDICFAVVEIRLREMKQTISTSRVGDRMLDSVSCSTLTTDQQGCSPIWLSTAPVAKPSDGENQAAASTPPCCWHGFAPFIRRVRPGLLILPQPLMCLFLFPPSPRPSPARGEGGCYSGDFFLRFAHFIHNSRSASMGMNTPPMTGRAWKPRRSAVWVQYQSVSGTRWGVWSTKA
jgi:hypothetical protein